MRYDSSRLPFISVSLDRKDIVKVVLSNYLRIAVPVLLTLFSVRLVMTTQFLQLEYNRPGFPEDVYGFTQEDRLYYAPFAIEYLTSRASIKLLGDLSFSNGRPLYTERELQHMIDVKLVTQYAFGVLYLGIPFTFAALWYLWKDQDYRPAIKRGLFEGSILTLGLIGIIVILAVTMWDFFFATFHNIFFESGTWMFAYSDTLIRLFPEQFWFDAALVIGVLTGTCALFILTIIWHTNRSSLRYDSEGR